MITEEQRQVMQHALGVTRGNREYRNHFVTGPGSDDYPHCIALVNAGMMTRRAGNALSGGDDIFTVTELGRTTLKTPSPPSDECPAPSCDECHERAACTAEERQYAEEESPHNV